MNQPEVFRAGVIGAGNVATKYHLPVLVQLPHVRVEWVYDIDRARAAGVARQFKVAAVPETLENAPAVDAVLLAVPVGLRAGSWDVILARRWHVLCEKPFATSHAWHNALIGKADEKDICVAVGHMRRYYSSTEVCRSVVKSGLLGQIREIVANDGGRMRGTGRGGNWYQNSAEQTGGGGFAETGSHLVDQLMYAADVDRFAFESARGVFINGGDFDATIRARAARRTDEGIPCEIGVSRLVNRRTGIHIKFEGGFISLPVALSDAIGVFDNSGRSVCSMRREGAAMGSIYQVFAKEWLDFIEWCSGGDECRISAKGIEPVTEMIDWFYTRAIRETVNLG